MTLGAALKMTLERTADMMGRVEGQGEGFAYASLYEFVVKNGRPFDPRPLPARWKYRAQKHCYWNTYEIVRRSKGRLHYVEGYGITDRVPLPMLHAWAIDEAGLVIDTTWRTPAAYYGIVFPFELVREAYEARGRKVIAMIDDWERGYPLLKEGAWPPKAS